MKHLLAIALLLLGCALMAAFLLGVSALDRDLPFGLNAGVAAAAVSLIACATGPVLLVAPVTPYRRFSCVALFAAILWLPVSVALAGGMQLSYAGWRSMAWLVLTGFVLLAVLGSWSMVLVSLVRSNR